MFDLFLSFRWLKRFFLDSYANYVVQKLIETPNCDEQICILHQKLESFYNEMRHRVCGRKIVERLNVHMLSIQFRGMNFPNLCADPTPYSNQF